MTIKDEIEKAIELRKLHQGAEFHSHDFHDGALWAMRWFATRWEKSVGYSPEYYELDAAADEILGKEVGE